MRGFSLTCLGVACGALFLMTPASAAPLNVTAPLDGSSSIIQIVDKYGPPPGKKCLKWTRRYHPSLGFGHRRCVQWK